MNRPPYPQINMQWEYIGGSYSSGVGLFIIRVVLKIMVPAWVPIIIRHLIFRVPKKRDHNFDNHPLGARAWSLGSHELVAPSHRGLGFRV